MRPSLASLRHRAVSIAALCGLVAAGLAGVAVQQAVAPDRAAVAAQDPTTCASPVALTNGGFEQPAVPAATYRLTADSQVPGWNTTATDHLIEQWSNGFLRVPADTGSQFVELNATQASTLYQDVATTPGQTLGWSLAHRGRNGTDVMRVVIGAPGGTLTQSGSNLSDGNTAWGHHDGTYTVPAGQTTTRFGFQAVSSVGGTSIGNLLDSIAFGTAPCLVTTKSVVNLSGNSPARVGDTLRYTVTTLNGGGTPANDSTMTDALPTGAAFVPGSIRIATGPGQGALTDAAGDDRGAYDADSRTLAVRLGTGADATEAGAIAAGTTTSVSFDARVTAAAANGTVENTAAVGYTDGLSGATRTSTSQTTSTPVGPAADLSLAKTLDTDPVVAGSPVRYTLTASNAGPQTATGVVVRDRLPAGVSDVTASAPGADCAVASGVVTCTLADIADGDSAAITVTGTVPADTAPGTGLANTASVTGTLPDPDPSNDTASASGSVTTSARLAVTKTASPAAPVAGGLVTYTITTTNSGPSDAADTTAADPIDPEVTYVSSGGDGACALSDGVVRCDYGVLPAGQSVASTIVVRLASGATAVQNTAAVTTSTPTATGTDPVASTSIDAIAVADLSVTKTAMPEASSVVAGDPARDGIDYSIVASNAGPSDATAAVVKDTLPAGLTVTSVDAPAGATCTATDSAVECTFATLAAGAGATIVVHAIVGADAAAGDLVNTATIASPADDPDTSNNKATATTPLETSADVAVTKRATPTSATAGDPLAFTITAANRGPSTARGVVVSDTLPAGLTDPSTTTPGCTIADDTLVCDAADIAPGESSSATVTATVDPNFGGTAIVNSATAVSGTPDPVSDDDTGTVTVPVARSADLSVTKTGPTEPVAAGGTVQYTVRVANVGPSEAVGVVVAEQPAPGLTVTGATTATGSWDAGAATWTVGTLAPGATATLTVTARTLVDGTLGNTVTVTSATPDPDGADDSATATVTALPSADLSITKTPSVDPLPQGGAVTYTMTVRNAGPSTADGVVVEDDLPAVLTDPSTDTPGCTVTGQRLACTVDPLASGDTAEVLVTATVDPSATGDVANTATVRATTPDPDPANDSATSTTAIASAPAIALTKTVSDPTDTNEDGQVGAGDELTYTFTVRNTGTSPLSAVVIDDPMLGGPVDCTAVNGRVLQRLATVECTATYALTQADVDAGTVPNTASVSATAPGGGSATDSASVTTTIAATPSITLTKTASAPQDVDGDGRVSAGDRVAYSFVVTNTGNVTIDAVGITDPKLTGAVRCDVTSIPAAGIAVCDGPSYVLTQADVDAGTVTNSATATGSAPDGTPTSADGSVTTSLTAVRAVSLEKRAGAYRDADGNGKVDAGDTLDYSFTVRNTGDVTLRGLVIDDPKLGGAVDCDLPDLAPGQSADCGPVAYRITAAEATTGSVTNGATVVGFPESGTGTTDPVGPPTPNDPDAPGVPPVGSSDSVTSTLPALAYTGATLSAVPFAAGLLGLGLLGLLAVFVGRRRRRA